MALLLLREPERSGDRLPNAARRVTKGYQMPAAAAGPIIGEQDTRLWCTLKAHVAVAYPQADWSQVTCVGCDEMSVRKGSRVKPSAKTPDFHVPFAFTGFTLS